MTENKENVSKEKEPMPPKKKWLLISLCSVALLGGAVGYGIYNNQPNNQANDKVEQTDSSDKETKKSSSAWEEQIAPKKEKKTKESKSADDVLNVVAGDKKENSLFGVQIPSASNKKGLVNDLAQALDEQTKKEAARKDSEVVHAAEVDKAPSKDTGLSKEQIPDNGKGEPGVKAPDSNNDFNLTPDPLPNPLPVPTPTPTPTPTPDPGPTPIPTPDPEPSIDELVAQSKEELTEAADKANAVNDKLLKVKVELDNMQNIESETKNEATKAAEQWDKVQSLIDEYNQLSEQLKQLIAEDGTVPEVNLDLYKETYDKLNQKVTEIKGTQDSANATTSKMNTNIQNAEDTLNQIDQTKVDYQNSQQEVSNTANQVDAAVSTANKNDQVASEVQPEITQAKESSNTMKETNTEVGNQLNQVNTEETQQAIDSANQAAQTVNDQVAAQNSAVADVVNDFNSLPKPETPTVPDNPTVEVQQQTSGDQMAISATETTNQSSEVVVE